MLGDSPGAYQSETHLPHRTNRLVHNPFSQYAWSLINVLTGHTGTDVIHTRSDGGAQTGSLNDHLVCPTRAFAIGHVVKRGYRSKIRRMPDLQSNDVWYFKFGSNAYGSHPY